MLNAAIGEKFENNFSQSFQKYYEVNEEKKIMAIPKFLCYMQTQKWLWLLSKVSNI